MRDSNFHAEFHIKNDNNQDIEEMLNECIFVMTMYTDIIQWEKLEILCKSNRSNNKEFDVIMEYVGEDTYFEVTSFVKLSTLYPEYLYKMEKLLLEGFTSENSDSASIREFKKSVCDKIKGHFDKQWNDYYNWDMNYGGMVFPIHNLDLMYNLVKHLFMEHKEQNAYTPVLEDGMAFLDEFSAMIQSILKHLNKIDEFYCLSGKESFSGKLMNSPFIQLLNRIKGNENIKIFMGNYLNYIQIAVGNLAIFEKSSDEP